MFQHLFQQKKELEEFYNLFNQAFSICESTEVQVVMGDFNAKIGRGSQYPVAGPYGLGERNECGGCTGRMV